MAFAVTLFASCDKSADTTTPDAPDANGTRIQISLDNGGDVTRAFFDNTATAETWEKSLSSLSVFVFNNDGGLLICRDFTSSELAAKSATFALPKSAAGTPCNFVGVANYDASSARTQSELLALLETSATDYNGTFAEVTTKAKRTGGFVMSGQQSQTVGAVNSTTNVGITLRRTVAKVALQVSIDSEFAQKYPGTLTLGEAKLSKAALQTAVVAGATPKPGAMSYTHTQPLASAASNYNGLFYLYENGPLTSGNRVLLEITAMYDSDGNASTTNDRSEVTYTMELTGKAAGEILRNGYYRVAATIKGLVGQDCIVSISVADWEVPITQHVDLGA